MKKNSKKGVPLLIQKFQGKDFSEVEDSPQEYTIISAIGFLPGRTATAEAQAAGLPEVFVRDNEIIRQLPNGTDPLSNRTKYYYFYKQGTILNPVRK